MDDATCTACTLCRAEFTVVRRKHHCRCCGAIICRLCSPDRAPVPGVSNDSRVRICAGCHAHLSTDPSSPFCLARSCLTLSNAETLPEAVGAAARAVAEAATRQSPQLSDAESLRRVLVALVPLAHTGEAAAQRHAVGALSALAAQARQKAQVLDAGVVPVLVDLLHSVRPDALRRRGPARVRPFALAPSA